MCFVLLNIFQLHLVYINLSCELDSEHTVFCFPLSWPMLELVLGGIPVFLARYGIDVARVLKLK